MILSDTPSKEYGVPSAAYSTDGQDENSFTYSDLAGAASYLCSGTNYNPAGVFYLGHQDELKGDTQR